MNTTNDAFSAVVLRASFAALVRQAAQYRAMYPNAQTLAHFHNNTCSTTTITEQQNEYDR